MTQTTFSDDSLEALAADVAAFREKMLAAFQAMRLELAELTGKVVSLEDVKAVIHDAQLLKVQLREMPAQLAEVTKERDEIELTLEGIQGEITRLIANEARGGTAKTKDERRADAIENLTEDSTVYRKLLAQEHELVIESAQVNAALTELTRKDKNVGRECQLIVGQMNLLAAQISTL